MEKLTRYDFPLTASIEARDYDAALAWFNASVRQYGDDPTVEGLSLGEIEHEGVTFLGLNPGITDDALKASNVMTYTRADEGITRDGVVPVIGLDKVAKAEAVEA